MSDITGEQGDVGRGVACTAAPQGQEVDTNTVASEQAGNQIDEQAARQGLKGSVPYDASVTVSPKTLWSLSYKHPICFPVVALSPNFKSDCSLHCKFVKYKACITRTLTYQRQVPFLCGGRLFYWHIWPRRLKPCSVDLRFHYHFKHADSSQVVPEMDHLESGQSAPNCVRTVCGDVRCMSFVIIIQEQHSVTIHRHV